MADEDPRQLAAQFELVQRELARVEARLGALQDALVETQQARSTVAHLAEGGEAGEVLVPLGAGVHVRASIAKGAAVLLPIGAGYATESGAKDVAAALEERQQAITRQFQQASEEAERLADVAAQINERLSSLSPK